MAKSYNDEMESSIEKYQTWTDDAVKDQIDRINADRDYAIEQNKKLADEITERNKKFGQGVKNADIYGKSFREAQGAAEGAAAAQGAQAQQAGRQAGMSKAAAAEMGANARQQSYNQNLLQQQGISRDTMMDKIGTYGQSMNAANQAKAQAMANTINARNAATANLGAQQMAKANSKLNAANFYGGRQTEAYNQNLGYAGLGVQGAGIAADAYGTFKNYNKGGDSDIRLKDFIMNNDNDKTNEDWKKKVDALLKKDQEPADFQALIITTDKEDK